MTNPLPQDGDTIVLSRVASFICCSKEFLEDVHNEDVQKSMRPNTEYVYGYKPTNEGIAWMLWSTDAVPPFVPCFKNKPKDKIFYQEVRYDTEVNSTSVSGLALQQHPWDNTKLTFCGVSGKLKSCEIIQVN
jgi:hypothetical protein